MPHQLYRVRLQLPEDLHELMHRKIGDIVMLRARLDLSPGRMLSPTYGVQPVHK